MKLGMALAMAAGLVTGQVLPAQAQAPPKNPPDQQQPSSQKPPTHANPFPEDTNNVPLMPNGKAPVPPQPPASAAPAELPRADVDPVRSPDDPQGNVSSDAEGFSSSSSGLDNLTPPPDND